MNEGRNEFRGPVNEDRIEIRGPGDAFVTRGLIG